MKGAREEDLALEYLTARGLELISRNARAPGGELDLVMREKECLVIIEVRKRSNSRFGSAAESVDARKQARIIKATRGLISREPRLGKMPVRFDVVALDQKDQIDWIRAAFDASE